jgi:hypothetical protein
MYGIRIIINNKKGNIAVKKLNAMALARVVSAPLKIPITYISNRSYTVKPLNPGRLTRFKRFAIQLTIGILSNLFSID